MHASPEVNGVMPANLPITQQKLGCGLHVLENLPRGNTCEISHNLLLLRGSAVCDVRVSQFTAGKV